MLLNEIYKSLDSWGEHPAFIELIPQQKPVYTSAEEFKQKIKQTAQFLRNSGVQKNFLVAMFLENSVDFVACFLGLIEIGAKPVALKLDYRQIELDEIFNNANPQAVIIEKSHLSIVEAYLKNRIVISREQRTLSVLQQSNKKPNPYDIDDSIASVNYTYRGYGYPLGALVPHSQYIHGAKVLLDGLKPKKGENMLVILPMSHIFTLIGCIFSPFLKQMTTIIARSINPRVIFEYIKEYNINNITSVPEIYGMLAKFKEMAKDISSLKVFVCGGSFLSKESYNKIKEAFNIDLLHGYGLTEFTPVSRNIRGEARAGTIGPVCRDLEVKIDSPDTNGIGEILLKTEYMAKEYYKRPEETKEAFNGKWFKTGDLGYMDNGHLVFVKEKKNTRKVNGLMVDLEEVKKAVSNYKKTKDVRIEFNNNQLSIALTLSQKADFKRTALELKMFLSDKLSSFKIPKIIKEL